MNGWMILLPALAGAALYLLYRRGLLVTKCVAAVLFVFLPGRDGDTVSLYSCTGWVRRAGRFRESRVYDFRLEDRLSKGTAEVTLLDQARRPLLRLGRQAPQGSVRLDGEGRYFLRWDFREATGKCRLRWR